VTGWKTPPGEETPSVAGGGGRKVEKTYTNSADEYPHRKDPFTLV
jgi:hypothetical protein